MINKFLITMTSGKSYTVELTNIRIVQEVVDEICQTDYYTLFVENRFILLNTANIESIEQL